MTAGGGLAGVEDAQVSRAEQGRTPRGRLEVVEQADGSAMEPAAEALFVRAQKVLLVSALARTHIVRVARTIADLDGNRRIAERHLAEAVGYRGRDSR